MPQLTQKELKKLLKYNSKTGIFIWRKYMNGRAIKGCIAGSVSTKGYVCIQINKKTYKAHRLAWLYVYGYFPENSLDHKNRDKQANWIFNLREISRKCNVRNCGNYISSRSGVKGVVWDKNREKRASHITNNQRTKRLGMFRNFTEAAAHRFAAEQCLEWTKCETLRERFRRGVVGDSLIKPARVYGKQYG